ncbi:MAG: hypothetical protein ABL955_03240 [Elusimicrobiota bacterium]
MIPVSAAGRFLFCVSVFGWTAFIAGWLRMGLGDWTEQRIRHAQLILWSRLTAGGYAVLGLHSLAGAAGWLNGSLGAAWWLGFLLHVVVSAGAAWLLWSLRVWPAGDVKLFTLLAVLSPLLRLPGSFHDGRLFLETLINTFVPAAAYLLLAATVYLWRTRFTHQAAFLRNLGLEKLPSFLWNKAREISALMLVELKTWLEEYRAEPKRFALDAAAWIAQMVVMSLVTYQIGSFITSNFLRTLVCFAIFFGWSRFAANLGKGRALALTLVGFAVAVLYRGRLDWGELLILFGHISVFSLFIFFGVQLAFRAAAGQSAMLLLPFLFMIPSLIPFGSLRAWLLGLSVPVPAVPTALQGLGTWAVMGLFFGLALVFVRIWDAESYLSVRTDQIEPYMTPGPGLVALIEADEDFRDRHFSAFYADGLTPDQARVLRAWCRDNEIAEVPLAPTISFANWIYLGYFLTALLQGHVLQAAY